MNYKFLTAFFLALCISTAQAGQGGGNGTSGGAGEGGSGGSSGEGSAPCHIEFDSSEFPQS